MNARLTLFAALSMPAIAVSRTSSRARCSRSRAIVQAKKGHLTEATDEAVVGIEMVQAFGRETTSASASPVAPRRYVRDDAPGRRRGAVPSGADLHALARDRRGALLRRPRRIEGTSRSGSSRSSSPCCYSSSGRSRLSAGSLTSGSARRPRPRAASPGSTHRAAPGPEQPRTLPDGPLSSASRTCTSATASARKCSRDRPRRRSRARSSPSAERPAPARPRCSTCCRACTTPPPGACCSAASTSASSAADLRRAVALVTQKPVLFSVPLRDNLLAARPDADWEEVLAACEAAGVAAFVDELPTATTPSSASAASTSRAGSASGSRWRARSSRARA